MRSRIVLTLAILNLMAALCFAKDKTVRAEVVLNQSLGSDISQAGQDFSGTLNKAVSLPSGAVLERGALVSGRVLHVESTQNYTRPGDLELVLTTVRSGDKMYEVHSNTLILMGRERRVDPTTGKVDDRGARREDAARAASGVIFGNPGVSSGSLGGTNVSVSPSSQITGMQVILTAKSKITFTLNISE